MATITGDTGHAVNVGNYNSLVVILKNAGGRYQPANPDHEVAELEKKAQPAMDAVTDVAGPEELYDQAVNDRKADFELLKPKTNNALGSFTNSKDVTPDEKARATTKAKLIKGTNAKKKEKKEGEKSTPEKPQEITEKKHSVYQLSYVKRAANLSDFVSILENNSAYKPKDADAKPATLRAFHGKLVGHNSNVETAFQPYLDKLKDRDIKLYSATGIVNTALEIKDFVKKSDKFTKDEKKRIAAIKFRKPAKSRLHF